MSGTGGMDLRLPIGALFSVLGVVLAAYGVATRGDAARYAPSGNVNVNLWWGLAMLLFGVAMLLGARLGRRPQGRRVESTIAPLP
jgi:hypothetical protein